MPGTRLTGRLAGDGSHLATARPPATDPEKIAPTGTTPQSLWRATAARPADATHPQLLQSGEPPNWHGSMRVVRSAEIVVVVRAKTHSDGESGGLA